MAPKETLEEALAKVSAPEDFPPELSDLADLDAALRCPICHDLFTNPVLLNKPKCCHIFCSVCIRNAMALSSNRDAKTAGTGGVGGSMKCPTCRQAADEGALRRVPRLDEAVVAWEKARPRIMELVEKTEGVPTMNGVAKGKGRKRKAEEEDEAEYEDYIEDSEEEEESRLRKTRRMTRSASAANGKKATKKPPLPNKVSSSRDMDPADRSSDIEELAGDPNDPNTLVPCPICGKRIKNSEQDVHVTRCLSGDSGPSTSAWKFLSQQPTASTSALKPPLKSTRSGSDSAAAEDQPLATISYSGLKAPALRDKLAGLGVPVDKKEKDVKYLVARHQQYTLLHNANLDADPKRRKTKTQLRRDLEEWDKKYKSENAGGGSGGSGMKDESANPLDNKAAMKRHGEKYGNEFDDLIRKARMGEMKRRKALQEQKKAENAAHPGRVPQAREQGGDEQERDAADGEGASSSSEAHIETSADVSLSLGENEAHPLRPRSPSLDLPALAASAVDGPSPPPSPTGLAPDIPLEHPPEADPYEEQLRQAGPYSAWAVPAPSQNVGVRQQGMGFNEERDGGLEGAEGKRGSAKASDRMDVIEEGEDEDI